MHENIKVTDSNNAENLQTMHIPIIIKNRISRLFSMVVSLGTTAIIIETFSAILQLQIRQLIQCIHVFIHNFILMKSRGNKSIGGFGSLSFPTVSLKYHFRERKIREAWFSKFKVPPEFSTRVH